MPEGPIASPEVEGLTQVEVETPNLQEVELTKAVASVYLPEFISPMSSSQELQDKYTDLVSQV